MTLSDPETRFQLGLWDRQEARVNTASYFQNRDNPEHTQHAGYGAKFLYTQWKRIIQPLNNTHFPDQKQNCNNFLGQVQLERDKQWKCGWRMGWG